MRFTSLANLALFALASSEDGGVVEDSGTDVCHCHDGVCETLTLFNQNVIDAHVQYHGDIMGPCPVERDIRDLIQSTPNDPLDESGAIVLNAGGNTIVAAPDAALAVTPPQDLLDGNARLGRIYVNIPDDDGIPTGYYDLRLTGGDVNLPVQSVNVEMTNIDNGEVVTIPGTALTNRNGAPVPTTGDPTAIVSGSITQDPGDPFRRAANFNGNLPAIEIHWEITIYYLCDNGLWVCATYRW